MDMSFAVLLSTWWMTLEDLVRVIQTSREMASQTCGSFISRQVASYRLMPLPATVDVQVLEGVVTVNIRQSRWKCQVPQFIGHLLLLLPRPDLMIASRQGNQASIMYRYTRWKKVYCIFACWAQVWKQRQWYLINQQLDL